MKMLAFAKRNTKEILRDPMTVGFGLGFPLVILLLLHTIQSNIPVSLFELSRLTPGITVFGLSFVTLFSATLIARDRKSALFARLYTTPLRASDFIFGYTLPLIPLSLLQCVITYAASLLLGLAPSPNILCAVLGILPCAILFIALGLLCGSVMTDKQVGGFCGSLLTNLTAWLSGTWFDLSLVGGVFQKAAYLLPFVHAVEMERALLAGNFSGIFPHLFWVCGYAAAACAAAILLFLRQMKNQ